MSPSKKALVLRAFDTKDVPHDLVSNTEADKNAESPEVEDYAEIEGF